MFELHVQLTRRSYGRVTAALLLRRLLYADVLGALVVFLLIFDFIFTPSVSVKWEALILYVLVHIGLFFMQRWFAFGWRNHPAVMHPMTFRLSEEGLTLETAAYRKFATWVNFIGIRQLGSAVVLFVTRNKFLIFPNESFSSAQECQDVVAFVRQHIPADRQRKLKFPTVKRFILRLSLWFAIVIIGIGVFIRLLR